jgi:hypothetical protein
MIVQIQALNLKLSQKEILAAINPKTLEEIKAENPRPYFQAYSIVHEGTSTPNVINEVNKPMKWLREAVEAASLVVKKGVQFFAGHVLNNNSTNGRDSLGKVVGKITKEINGKLNQIVVGYFPNKDKVKNFDVCSIEADVQVESKDTIDIVHAIKNLSGIALANSNQEKPAFKGAVRLASLQCFDGESEQSKNVVDNNDGDKKMTYEEFTSAISTNFNWLKQAMVDKKIYPSQLGFTEQDLRSDFAYKEMFSKMDNQSSTLKTLEDQLKMEKEERIKDQKESLKATAKDRMKKFIPEGFTEKQKTWLNNVFDADKIEDLSDNGLKAYVEASPTEYKKQAKAFGIQEDNIIDPPESSQERFNVEDTNEETVSESLLDEILEREEE